MKEGYKAFYLTIPLAPRRAPLLNGATYVCRQAMDVTEALREATEFSRTLSSPEAFLVVMAELLADGFEVNFPTRPSTETY